MGIFKFPKDWDNGLVRDFGNNGRWDGIRKCNNNEGLGFGINTSRLSDFTATYVDFLSYGGRYGLGSSNSNIKNFLIMGIASIHSTSTIPLGEEVVYWSGANYNNDSVYIQILLSLPWFTLLGNTPVSTTDRDALTLQIYQAGMWIWRDGNLPPISKNVLFNFQFDDGHCYDNGAGPMRSQPPNLITGSVNGTTTNMYNVASESNNPWMGTWTNDGNGYINIANTLTPSADELTHEWIGKRNDTSGNEYISDARNGGGTWLLSEYSGFDFNWSNQLQVNNSNGYNKRHWGCVTANNAANFSAMYYGSESSNTWDGQIGTGTCTPSMVNIGANFRIGTRYTDSGRWNGYMGMYRIWDGQLSNNQAEICWLHERYKVYTL